MIVMVSLMRGTIKTATGLKITMPLTIMVLVADTTATTATQTYTQVQWRSVTGLITTATALPEFHTQTKILMATA
ncbi:MAG: hypothetical protein CL931_00110 [Deltaproteobacteria bacterium]|nr:hypothetical protein [Deltaproteobacteria bacterium]